MLALLRFVSVLLSSSRGCASLSVCFGKLQGVTFRVNREGDFRVVFGLMACLHRQLCLAFFETSVGVTGVAHFSVQAEYNGQISIQVWF